MQMEEICVELQSKKINTDKMNCYYFSKADHDVCNYVVNYIPKFNFSLYHGKRISKKSVIKNGLKQFNVFGNDNCEKLIDIIRDVEIKKDHPTHCFSITTTFDIINYTSINKKIINPGYISQLHLAKKIYDVDVICLGHEYCHALKETNLKEYRNTLILGEVIPIFYELINYENDFLRQKFLEYRLSWANQNQESYIFFSNKLDNISRDYKSTCSDNDIYYMKELYEYTRDYFGSYLCGFYYALILYHMYREDPIYILEYVKGILSHEITTMDMLTKFNIYCDIKGEIFDKEFKNIKRVLSR